MNIYMLSGYFKTVDDFIDPLIQAMQPDLDYKGTIAEYYINNNNISRRNKIEQIYGEDNIKDFINLCDKEGFKNVITDLWLWQIKTVPNFVKYLNNKKTNI